MTAKTPKEDTEGALRTDAVPAEDTSAAEVEASEEPAPSTTQRKRRVRVIEVIDDDLDEVPEEDEAQPRRRLLRRFAGSGHSGESAPAGSRGTGRSWAIVVALLVAVLACLTIWQWRTAATLSAEADKRAAVHNVAASYGDVALNYNASNYQSQMSKTQRLLGGDLLEQFKSNTLPNLGNTFKDNPELVLSSKTNEVFVGSVDERFASATISVDVGIRSKEGAQNAPATLIRLAMAKIDGEWKVTKMYASGQNDDSQKQGGLPTVPSSPGEPAQNGDEPKN